MEINWKRIIYFKWFKRLYILYIFGFFLNFRPAAPFIYEFLLKEKGFTENDVNEDVFPMLFYSTSVQLLPVFLLMDVIKFNPFIIIATCTGTIATCLYIWTNSVREIVVAQAFYGSTTAAEVAYYVSIYAHGNEKNYQRLTSYVRAGPMLAKMIASFLAQLFISMEWLSYTDLYYFNLSAFIVATVLTIFVPPAKKEEEEEEQNGQKSKNSDETPVKWSSIFTNLTKSFPNKYVVKWTIWSMLTVCGYNQISLYVQPLWKLIQENNEGTIIFNGVLEGIYAFWALIGTILGGFAAFDWKFKGDLILSMTSLVVAFMLLFMSQIENVVLNCMFYVIIGFIYHFVMTILCGEIAKFLTKGRFGLVFGLIALVGNVLSIGMVMLLNEDIGFQLKDFQDLFMIYGFYHLGISILFIIVGLSYWFAKHTYQ